MNAAPPDRRIVLAVAIALPGTGHVLLGQPARGLGFALFTLSLGWLSTKIAPAEASFLLRHAGAALVWGLSVIDAHRIARILCIRAKNKQSAAFL
ncbi:hypothetical protein ACFQI3_16955 [Hansschlegelia quercus]|uniref:Uncharacterized protein n=1 Tax=Hansschlegelia quercus TaxID=2528245 RepID=A0A4Q9GJH3_9HYPH|nr:hypothetical protein [Hansschlegelia quercus]TBN52608.1 hypothetical protein EYR15_12350 [Hansschlegelia quercus]